jgi:hypothetical protein
MTERIILACVLLAALAVIVQSVRRALTGRGDDGKPPSCAGCPFDSKCQMQDRDRAETQGNDSDE